MWPNSIVNSYFEGTDEIVESVGDADPDSSHISEDDNEPDIHGRRVKWIGNGFIVAVDADKIHFMEGNQWRLAHAAGVMEAMRDGKPFEVPAARIRRIRKTDVTDARRHEKAGDLLEQYSMVRPWTDADVGKYKAQLLDGNHRAAAAMALGEQTIYVYVSENYRKEVRKKDWL